MSAHILEPLVAISAASLGVALLQADTPPGAQQWTVLGLLAFVIVGIGNRLVKSSDKITESIDRNTAAQASVAQSLDRLTTQTNEARREHEEKARQILAAIAEVPEATADRIRKPA
jgi:hypothetical protein